MTPKEEKLVRMTLYEMIDKDGLQAVGKANLLKHLDGGKLTRKEAMQAKCYDCMGYFIDGRADCCIKNCPMYGYRPFKDRQESKKLDFTTLPEAKKATKDKKASKHTVRDAINKALKKRERK